MDQIDSMYFRQIFYQKSIYRTDEKVKIIQDALKAMEHIDKDNAAYRFISGNEGKQFLVLSSDSNHLFCIVCVCFGKNGGSLSALCSTGLKMAVKYVVKKQINSHSLTLGHINAMKMYEENVENVQSGHQLSEITDNDAILRNRHVVRAVICCLLNIVTQCIILFLLFGILSPCTLRNSIYCHCMETTVISSLITITKVTFSVFQEIHFVHASIVTLKP